MVIEMNLSPLTAAALAAALVAAASVLAFSAIPALFVWAAFIGWASYDHSGATRQAALHSSAALVFGVVMAWAVAVVVAAGILPLSASLATAVTAGIASFLIVWRRQDQSSVSSPPRSTALRQRSLILASYPGRSRSTR
jgi:hypothetical protein